VNSADYLNRYDKGCTSIDQPPNYFTLYSNNLNDRYTNSLVTDGFEFTTMSDG